MVSEEKILENGGWTTDGQTKDGCQKTFSVSHLFKHSVSPIQTSNMSLTRVRVQGVQRRRVLVVNLLVYMIFIFIVVAIYDLSKI